MAVASLELSKVLLILVVVVVVDKLEEGVPENELEDMLGMLTFATFENDAEEEEEEAKRCGKEIITRKAEWMISAKTRFRYTRIRQLERVLDKKFKKIKN